MSEKKPNKPLKSVNIKLGKQTPLPKKPVSNQIKTETKKEDKKK